MLIFDYNKYTDVCTIQLNPEAPIVCVGYLKKEYGPTDPYVYTGNGSVLYAEELEAIAAKLKELNNA